jgi:hypothetical protein
MHSDQPRTFIIVDDSTICEPRDQQEERRDRKRRRADDDEDKAGVNRDVSFESLPASGRKNSVQLEKDEEYYSGPLQDDEHVLCLRNTLYKVCWCQWVWLRLNLHRVFFLFQVKTSSLDQCPTLKDLVFRGEDYFPESDRWTDENPLRIHQHVAPDELKALLWAIQMSYVVSFCCCSLESSQ